MTGLFSSPDGRRPAGYARIAVERGIDRYPHGLTYAIPPALEDLAPGERVIVPLGRGDTPTAGYVIEVADDSPLQPDAVKFIDRRDEAAVRLPPDLLQLAGWISNYYCAPIGMTLTAMLPAAVKRNVGAVTRTFIDLGDPCPLEVKLPPKQRAVLETLAQMDAGERPVEMHDLAERAGSKTTGPVRRLLDRGLLESIRKTNIEAAWTRQAADTFVPETLTAAQQQVIDEVGAALDGPFSAHLLFGVTGSGKTEIYIRLIRRALAEGRTALMLVPEISLTPQTGGRLVGRFPRHHVAILHSGLTAAQRHQQWAMVADGSAPIVLGARSAVFAPIPDGRLGLVIVDEEHDSSYKQDQAPRYHGRDVAIRRAQLAGCPILLGSATPSLESWFNATERGIYRLHRLKERVTGMRLPTVRVLDFVEQRKARKEGGVHLLGPALEEAVGRTLHSGGQVLLLLNRRGYANYIACPDQRCGWVMTCDRCDVTMVYHKDRQLPTGGFVQCHHCQAEQKLPATCPDCGRRITTFGLGTQRVEEELTRKFPRLEAGRSMMRVDSDTMRNAADFHDVLGRFGAGEIRLLIGTQMIAKGLDYPLVRLVGVINADTAINLPDFRATERTFQLVNQVSGRSGRSAGPEGMGLVIVQTFNPMTPAIQHAAAHDYESFAQTEIEERRSCGLPPVTRMARIVVRDADHVTCVAAARALADGLRTLAAKEIRVRGPAPCPISRLAGRHRQQVEILAPTARVMQALLTAARNRDLIHPGASMAVDVDPIALL
ncbi:MAG: primosomal protein N' [Planctomycetota bacterium]|nr:primosomal protein N' [Planctomycetota bacterium]